MAPGKRMILPFARQAWLLAAVALAACTTTTGFSSAPPRAASAEAATAARFATLKADRPAELAAFLRAMPKGGDLHSHLSGVPYAETYIAWAEADRLCLVVTRQAFAAPPCDSGAGRPPVAEAVADTAAYNALIDALSTRNYERRPVSGHDQFFATFDRFGAAGNKRGGDMIAIAMRRAASEHVSYLELMTSPGMSEARALGKQVGWDDDLARFRAKLDAAGLGAIVARARAEFAAMDARARTILDCTGAHPSACDVTVRYLAQIIRVFPPAQVFAETALAFVLVKDDPSVVGLNIVAPEDDRTTLRDYRLQMHMIGALHHAMPDVPISLHAGELALGLVPPEDLRFHIRDAVETAGARRIGHGVDILREDRPYQLLREMAKKHIDVEINLTSNDVILGVRGKAHPFATYRAYGVPLTLSTDDEGVSRIDLTHEYVRATETYDLGYRDVKALARNGLAYAFLPGASLWADARSARRVAACAADDPGAKVPTAPCATFLANSEKAQMQWRLEAAFRHFEAGEAARAQVPGRRTPP